MDLLVEVNPMKQTDPLMLKYLIFIYIAYGLNADCTRMLENVKDMHSSNQQIQDQLFFSYVRERKLLQQ